MIEIGDVCNKLPNMEFKAVLEELEKFEKNLEYLEKEVSRFKLIHFLLKFKKLLRNLKINFSRKILCPM
jgi:hypothetical protein